MALSEVRREITHKDGNNTSVSEVELQETVAYIKKIYDKIQETKKEISEKKMAALTSIDSEYKELLDDLESKYAFYLKMVH